MNLFVVHLLLGTCGIVLSGFMVMLCSIYAYVNNYDSVKHLCFEF